MVCKSVFAIVNALWRRSLFVSLSVMCVPVCFAVNVNRMSYCTERNDKRLPLRPLPLSLYQFFLPCGSIYHHRERKRLKERQKGFRPNA